MRCAACLADAPAGSRFCPSCGRPLAGAPSATRPEAGAAPSAPRPGTGPLADDGQTSLALPDETVAARPDETVLAGSGAAAPPDDGVFTEGALLAGRYRIERTLGRGGMGVVYQARDERLGHAVALKFLPASLARDPRRLAQFHNEVRLARQISHPNVCRVYDIGEVDGHLFLSMELIEGRDLGALLASGRRFDEHDAIELTRQICAGLAAVHAQGVLHRDLKPANIMISAGGQARLMDFGIAEAGGAGEPDRITEGTPAYMAPEQLAGEGLSERSDIYALGLVMYELFTGRRLLSGETVGALRQQHATLAESLPAAPAGSAGEAIARCLARDPAQRPASAIDVASMLQTVILEDTKRARRVMQILAQASAMPLFFGSLLLVTRGDGAIRAAGFLLAVVLAAVIVAEFRYPLAWTVVYKGHRLHVQNHPVFGERFYIDDVLADRGRFGLLITLRGTIEKGEGAGERITATVGARIFHMSLRLVAETFAPGVAGTRTR